MSDEQAEILGYIGLGLIAMTYPIWLPVLCSGLLWVSP
jgi:hypothetical protein